MSNTHIAKIVNFNLSGFGNLLNQSLMVAPQLMIEFNESMIKSCSFSSTKSFIKLWTIPINNLIINKDAEKDEIENQLALVPKVIKEVDYSDLDFNFYILKGDLFKKYISVHSSENVDLEFTLNKIDEKWQASSVTISGKSDNNSPLKTTFTLTTEELITNKISDYSAILKECTPTNDMIELVLTDKQIQEIKGLSKKLSKAIVDNSPYITFTVVNNTITVNDKVFSIVFDIDPNSVGAINGAKLEKDEVLKFNILRSDFIITGDHTFNIFTSNKQESEKVIMSGKYGGSLILCLTTKISENSTSDQFPDDDDIDSLNLSEYGLGTMDDDLPF